MNKIVPLLCLFGLLSHVSFAQQQVFFIDQPGYPFVESAHLTVDDVKSALAARGHDVLKVDFEQFMAGSIDPKTALLIWPYGSAMSDDIWPAMYAYLQAGGNLFVPGGRLFFREVMEVDGRYTIGAFTNRFAEKLRIIDAEEIPVDGIAETMTQSRYSFLSPARISPARIERIYSILVMLSSRQESNRNGAFGTKDGTWWNILAGVNEEGLKMYPLVSEINREKEEFAGGRWTLCHFQATKGYWQSEEGGNLLSHLVDYALKKPMVVDVVPEYAFYNADEKPIINITFDKLQNQSTPVFNIVVSNDGETVQKEHGSVRGTSNQISFEMQQPVESGLYRVSMEVYENEALTIKSENGFLVGDLDYMSPGDQFGVNTHFLTRGGKSYPIAGMTYMSSENHRFYFVDPNPVVWDRDFHYMKASGVNMIRTGIWTGHDQIIDEQGVINERSMRAWDAFFYTAKKYDIPVQLNFYHMMPSVPGIVDPYTSPRAFEHQQKYVGAFAARYKHNPDIIWDLINEPTYGREGHYFTDAVPTGTPTEQKAWDAWLRNKYRDTRVIASNWNVAEEDIVDEEGLIKLPEPGMLSYRKFFPKDAKPLIAYDYNLFSQYQYNVWARLMKNTIRSTGSTQLVVTGQDEGGVMNRVLHHYIAEESDFNNLHNWWQLDDLMWDNIMAKTPNKPLVLQEVGNMRFTDMREHRRLSEEQLAYSLERKLAYGIGVEGAGYIPWIWNTNPYLYNENEAYIGLHRVDGTAKKEVEIFRDISKFLHDCSDYFSPANDPDICIIIPYSLQLSAKKHQAISATRQAVRALHYYNATPAVAVSEYHLGTMPKPPKLAILPSAQVCDQASWKTLMAWVKQGTVLLITGPADADPFFRHAGRFDEWNVKSARKPIVQTKTGIKLHGEYYPLSFYREGSILDLDRMDWGTESEEVKVLPNGAGKVIMTAYPVELNRHIKTTAALYEYACKVAAIERSFEVLDPIPGVVVRPMDYQKARLYFILSEDDADRQITIKDLVVDQSFEVNVPAGRARLLMVSKRDGSVLASY